MKLYAVAILALLVAFPLMAKKPKLFTKEKEPSALDSYVQEVKSRSNQVPATSPGSLYSATGRLADGFRDVRASQLFDLVTIIVLDRASAVSTGVTNTSRKSSANASVNSLAGPVKAGGVLANLASLSGNQQIQGQGTTSRATTLTTTLTAEVTDVLPNGTLVVRGQKEIGVNSEKQLITVRGIIRPEDLSPTNSITSDRLAQLEVHVNGKGVVGDAVKRPFILYRLLLGLLPF